MKDEKEDRKDSSREQMQKNDDKEKRGEEREHVGKYSIEALTQEITALGNQNVMFRDKKWHKRVGAIKAELQRQFKENPKVIQGLQNKLHAIEQGEL